MLQIRIYSEKPDSLDFECPSIIDLGKPHFTKNDVRRAMQEIDFCRMQGIHATAEFIANHKLVMHLEPVSYLDEKTGKFKRTSWYLGKTYYSDHAVVRKWGC